MEIFKRRQKFTYSFCAVCMQIIKENASDVNASYSTAAAEEVYIYIYICVLQSLDGTWYRGGISLSLTPPPPHQQPISLVLFIISLSLYRRLIVAFGKTPSYKLCWRALQLPVKCLIGENPRRACINILITPPNIFRKRIKYVSSTGFRIFAPGPMLLRTEKSG